MNERLVIELKRDGCLVWGRVLEQPEDTRGKGTLAKDDCFSVDSLVRPELLLHHLCVRGDDRTVDGKQFYCYYEQESDAVAACNSIKALVAKCNVTVETKDGGEFQVGDEVLVYDLQKNMMGTRGTVTSIRRMGAIEGITYPVIYVVCGDKFVTVLPEQLRRVPKPAPVPSRVNAWIVE